MIALLAPSKTMNFTPAVLPGRVTATEPQFHAQAAQIVQAVLEVHNFSEVLHASDVIVEKTRRAYEQWGNQTNPAIYAYVGDVYKGFFANTLSDDDVQWAQRHLITLSGLYGALRPLDCISSYRLEMKAKLPVGDAKDLYSFWGDVIAKMTDEMADGTICVLSSDEYAKVVTAHAKSRIVTPVFLDNKPNGKIGSVPIYSKMMRGVMARWIIDHRVDDPDRLQAFSMYGYSYDASRSTPDKPAFYREVMTPLRFQ